MYSTAFLLITFLALPASAHAILLGAAASTKTTKKEAQAPDDIGAENRAIAGEALAQRVGAASSYPEQKARIEQEPQFSWCPELTRIHFTDVPDEDEDNCKHCLKQGITIEVYHPMKK